MYNNCGGVQPETANPGAALDTHRQTQPARLGVPPRTKVLSTKDREPIFAQDNITKPIRASTSELCFKTLFVPKGGIIVYGTGKCGGKS
ncbi:hypothetical protein HMPREF3163_00695 [Actinomyces sp. HMSC08A01]|uniref:Uncharacterized protein n=1 Tax=Winkia neuii BV029A5 TaxID=888439 RepID=K0ZCM5_9ACTO|nr:hypothetical protein HMPREF9240_01707 [Winkia neuii BV029A5]OFT40237.1 hypothetical protein HMPREF3163_00695 [Actinomyces sp. HMSC08A01]PLB80115.1 hypothetical protein CYJ21_05445 [Actinomyces sp. UMB0138]PMC94126.1 hypothetical protein CJ188_02560 [Actinomyces sp. UMB0918]